MLLVVVSSPHLRCGTKSTVLYQSHGANTDVKAILVIMIRSVIRLDCVLHRLISVGIYVPQTITTGRLGLFPGQWYFHSQRVVHSPSRFEGKSMNQIPDTRFGCREHCSIYRPRNTTLVP